MIARRGTTRYRCCDVIIWAGASMKQTDPYWWEAAPPRTLPQVAVLVATMDSRTALAVGILSVPLWGKGKSVVRTKPNSTVTLKVGTDTFAPVRSDGDGKAVVPIVVPPGAIKGTATSKDESWDSGEIAPRASWKLVVEDGRAPEYFCRYHPMMKGMVGQGGAAQDR